MTPIVIGYVPTAQGDAALEWGLNLSERLDEHVIVVNTDVPEASDVSKLYHERLDALGERLRQRAKGDDLRSMPFGSDPAEHLLQVAAESNASLIVIGLHRRSPVGKALFGSTAQDVLLNAPCPVVTVRAR